MGGLLLDTGYMKDLAPFWKNVFEIIPRYRNREMEIINETRIKQGNMTSSLDVMDPMTFKCANDKFHVPGKSYFILI